MLFRWTKRRAWLGGIVAGMLLLAAGQMFYEGWIVGVRQYQALIFTDEAYEKNGPDFVVFIDGERLKPTFGIALFDGTFKLMSGAGPVRSTKSKVTLELVPRSQKADHRVHRFEIEIASKEKFCDAVVEIRGTEPNFRGCSVREYLP